MIVNFLTSIPSIIRNVSIRNTNSKCNLHNHPVTHCIFDLDGILLDTETTLKQVIGDMLKERGMNYSTELRHKVLGATSEDTCKTIAKELRMGEDAWKILLEEFRKRVHTATADCSLMPGAEKLVRHLGNTGIPQAIATSSREISYRHKIRKFQELFKLFHHVVCGGSDPEVKLGKPNPDIFIICAQRFGGNPRVEDCLVFEDSVNGVIAACKAGMQCVAVPNKDVPKGKFKDATLIVNSLEEFVPEYFGLPSYLGVK